MKTCRGSSCLLLSFPGSPGACRENSTPREVQLCKKISNSAPGNNTRKKTFSSLLLLVLWKQMIVPRLPLRLSGRTGNPGKEKFGVWRALVSGGEILSPSNLSSCVPGQLPLHLPEWPFHDPKQTMLFPSLKKIPHSPLPPVEHSTSLLQHSDTFFAELVESRGTPGSIWNWTKGDQIRGWSCCCVNLSSSTGSSIITSCLLTHPWLQITVWVSAVPSSEIPRSQLSTLRLVSSENDLGQESFSKLMAPARPAVTDYC